jgi:sterol desaturase/sphingolipid hydroxylase (fatty acid hydroxylase superfamily)
LSRLFFQQPSGPWLPVLFYGPIGVAGVLWNLVGVRPPLWAWAVLPVVGLLTWTLLEYVLHSHAFHASPWLPRLRSVQASHLGHHEFPKDPRRIVARLSISVPLALVLFALFWAVLMNLKLAMLALSGLVAGYLAYEGIHYWIHIGRRTRWLLRPLVKHHLYHHYKDDSRCYGVTSPLWDWVFRTNRPARSQAPGAAAPEVPAADECP